MDGSGHSGHAGSTYVLTCDIEQRVQWFRHAGLQTPDPADGIFSVIRQELAKQVQAVLPDTVRVVTVSMADLAVQILDLAHQRGRLQDDYFVVSTCPELADPAHGATLQLNRMVDHTGKSIGFGPRPGHPVLRDQVRSIARMAVGRKLVLVEDGAFTGSTMSFVRERFAEVGVVITDIVVGFTFPSSAGAVNQLRSDGVEFHQVTDVGEPLEWVPDHDFIPFLPGCGKVLGSSEAGADPRPLIHTGATYAVPYIRPYGPIHDWASIPPAAADQFSLTCIDLAIRLFERLDELNPQPIRIAELLRARQPVSMPFAIGSSPQPTGRQTVTAYLKGLRASLNGH